MSTQRSITRVARKEPRIRACDRTPHPQPQQQGAKATATGKAEGKASKTTAATAASRKSTTKPPPTAKPRTSNESGASSKDGHWTEEEHEHFLRCFAKYGKAWKKISDEMGTRTNEQIRTHAQKYFTKLAELRHHGYQGDYAMDGTRHLTKTFVRKARTEGRGSWPPEDWVNPLSRRNRARRARGHGLGPITAGAHHTAAAVAIRARGEAEGAHIGCRGSEDENEHASAATATPPYTTTRTGRAVTRAWPEEKEDGMGEGEDEDSGTVASMLPSKREVPATVMMATGAGDLVPGGGRSARDEEESEEDSDAKSFGHELDLLLGAVGTGGMTSPGFHVQPAVDDHATTMTDGGASSSSYYDDSGGEVSRSSSSMDVPILQGGGGNADDPLQRTSLLMGSADASMWGWDTEDEGLGLSHSLPAAGAAITTTLTTTYTCVTTTYTASVAQDAEELAALGFGM